MNKTGTPMMNQPLRSIRRRLLGTGAVLWCVGSGVAFAQDQPTLDELLDLAPTPRPVEDTTPIESPRAADDDPAVDGMKEQLSGEQLADAFAQAVADMDRVAERLEVRDDPGLDTQRLQESILERLDQLIEAAQQQQQSSSSSSGSGSGQSSNQDSSAQNAGQQDGQQPGDPGQQPGAAQAGGASENPGEFSPGAVGPINPGQGAIDELRQEWGALPPRLRDELSNGLDEPYSPVYRELTEAYYRRLAEEAE